MNFSDIEQFVKSGDYEVNIPLKNLKRTLDDFEKDYGLELNPDFQRGYVWSEEQQTAYLEFLLQGGVTARVIYFNSPEFGNEKGGNLDSTVICVDGLQRLTACLKFMNNEIRVFGHYFKEFEGSPRVMHDLKFNINSLPNREDILKWYIQFNSGGTIHTDEEINRVKNMLKEEKLR